ncbi:uncharacterized protein BcabD6B2_32960 [Babesia caballi]|uniref:Uncharacterized protein n=1 Tax=Babesia caballi TaxID=5871 RepID=A0AAV4LVI0_BABCB|nr:hypothetical protein, conserved [Babesia caballi]
MRRDIRRFALACYRSYRTYPGRKRVQVETKIKSPKRYDELRGGNPTTLLQGNLFTPESAGPRELAMLCFRIVSMGYADAGILLRYAECALRSLPQLRVKHLALVLQAISKFLATSSTVVGQFGDAEAAAFDAELAHREKLLLKVGELVEAAQPGMAKHFVRALPKDMGMIALSLVTVCDCAYRELDAEQHARLLNATLRTLGLLTEAIGPKLPFCEAPEYAALAKAFCGLPAQHEFAELFLRDLAGEVASLLLEKQDHLEELARGGYIGDDLVEALAALPRELTTIACALSRRVPRHRMWDRLAQCLQLMLSIGSRGDGSFAALDGQTLVLLATSMSRHVDVAFLLEALLERSSEPLRPQWLVTGMALSLRALDDVELAQRMWDALDFAQVPAMDDAAKAQLVHAVLRVPSVSGDQLAVVRSLYRRDASPELLVALYAARHRCGLLEPAAVLESIMGSAESLGVSSLISLLRSVDSSAGISAAGDARSHADGPAACAPQRGCAQLPVYDVKSKLLAVLAEKVNDVRPDKLFPLLLYVIDHHGGCTALVEKLGARVAASAEGYADQQLALLLAKLRGLGVDPDTLFEPSTVERLEEASSEDPRLVDRFVEAEVEAGSADDLRFSEPDEAEVAKLMRAHESHEGPALHSSMRPAG